MKSLLNLLSGWIVVVLVSTTAIASTCEKVGKFDYYKKKQRTTHFYCGSYLYRANEYLSLARCCDCPAVHDWLAEHAPGTCGELPNSSSAETPPATGPQIAGRVILKTLFEERPIRGVHFLIGGSKARVISDESGAFISERLKSSQARGFVRIDPQTFPLPPVSDYRGWEQRRALTVTDPQGINAGHDFVIDYSREYYLRERAAAIKSLSEIDEIRSKYRSLRKKIDQLLSKYSEYSIASTILKELVESRLDHSVSPHQWAILFDTSASMDGPKRELMIETMEMILKMAGTQDPISMRPMAPRPVTTLVESKDKSAMESFILNTDPVNAGDASYESLLTFNRDIPAYDRLILIGDSGHPFTTHYTDHRSTAQALTTFKNPAVKTHAICIDCLTGVFRGFLLDEVVFWRELSERTQGTFSNIATRGKDSKKARSTLERMLPLVEEAEKIEIADESQLRALIQKIDDHLK